ncbi:hypothetical protein QBC36DRAFT_21968 [Triangularia setosa]|uniref:Uncharacterized protein n=1 Tax=Triangularia setosa TaxID=2587417 RepID=A0AAN7A709_9PEZI|nr:hypothetical protein QBC36DRAFT_21968 [Podospora setosa]
MTNDSRILLFFFGFFSLNLLQTKVAGTGVGQGKGGNGSSVWALPLLCMLLSIDDVNDGWVKVVVACFDVIGND